MHCVHPTEPGPSQVELEGGRSVEAQEEGKESYSDDEDERCMVEEDRSHKKDVDPGLWPADLTDRDREAFVRALASRDDDDVHMQTCMYKSPAVNIVLVLVLNYKKQDSCKPLISYVKLLMGQLGPLSVGTAAAQRGPN